MKLGCGAASSRFWLGYIDEFQIFSRILSPEQILQKYISVIYGDTDKSVMVSDETELEDIWECIVIPSNYEQDYDPINSNELEIINYGGG